MPKKEQHFNDGGIPDGTINHVYEHTLGGFILFYFNSESGEPEQIMSFDSPAHSIALRKYISDWTKAVDKFELQNSVFHIRKNINDSNDESPDDDDEENEE